MAILCNSKRDAHIMLCPLQDPSAKKSFRIAAQVAGTVAGALLTSRYLNYHPRLLEQEEANNAEAPPILSPDQPIKVITFNVQFLAGTGYHFFYDGGQRNGS